MKSDISQCNHTPLYDMYTCLELIRWSLKATLGILGISAINPKI